MDLFDRDAPSGQPGIKAQAPVPTTPCANGCGAWVRGVDHARVCAECQAKGAPAWKREAYERKQ